MGKLEVKPGELVVLQLGIRFAIELPDGPSRGYVVEVFSGHFQLPDLGPIGTFFLFSETVHSHVVQVVDACNLNLMMNVTVVNGLQSLFNRFLGWRS